MGPKWPQGDQSCINGPQSSRSYLLLQLLLQSIYIPPCLGSRAGVIYLFWYIIKFVSSLPAAPWLVVNRGLGVKDSFVMLSTFRSRCSGFGRGRFRIIPRMFLDLQDIKKHSKTMWNTLQNHSGAFRKNDKISAQTYHSDDFFDLKFSFSTC